MRQATTTRHLTTYTVTVADAGPTVTDVYADDGAHMAGDIIDITITFDESVTVTGYGWQHDFHTGDW